MSRLTILAATLAALTLFSCKRSEKIAEVAQEDIDFATQGTTDAVAGSAQTMEDPGAPPGVSRWRAGFFFYSIKPSDQMSIQGTYQDRIPLRQICADISGSDTFDMDNDRVYEDAKISFNCNNRTDTLIRDGQKLILNYTIVGTLDHIDSNDNNPLVFDEVKWGFPFQVQVIVKDTLGNIKDSYSGYHEGIMSMSQVNPTTYKLVRYLKYAKENFKDACRYISFSETTYIFLDQAQGWYPGDTVGTRIVKTWPIGHGKLRACSGIDVDLSFSPTDTLKITKCPNGNTGISSGGIRIILKLPTGTKEFTKEFSCQ